jgi:hypothetical protein
MNHYGIDLPHRDVLCYGDVKGMNPRDQIPEHFPELKSYYHSTLEHKKDSLYVVLVEEKSLLPILMCDNEEIIAYLTPLMGEGMCIDENSLCYVHLDSDWVGLGMTLFDEAEVSYNAMYLAPWYHTAYGPIIRHEYASQFLFSRH